MIIRFSYIAAICCGLSIGMSWGQASFQCMLDTNIMLIGDQHTLTLEVRGAGDIQLDTISFGDWHEMGFETLEPQIWDGTPGGIYHQQLSYAIYDTGYFILPPLALPYRLDGDLDTLYSNDLAVEVRGISVDSTGLAPIKTIIREPLNFLDVLPYFVLLVLALIAISWFWLRKKSASPPETIIHVPIPAHEVALRDLAALHAQKLWQSGKIKAYQTSLTHIIRAYLEDRFDIPALESTTGEILEDLKKVDLPDELMRDVDKILNIADLIKFAKARPEVAVHQSFMEKAEHFVRSTKEEDNLEQAPDA